MTENKNELDLPWQPNYIGIGTMKAASEWIYKCLREHPEISGAETKELHFFDQDTNYRKGVEHYRFCFATQGISGEFSPQYLYEPAVPARIHACFPSVKMIACLRDPADRAWSEYRYALQMHGRLSVYPTFSEAYKSDKSLAEMGRYATQLQRYYQLFQKNQIKILFYEDIQTSPLATVEMLYGFLDVIDTSFIPETASKRKNQTGDRKITIKYKRTWDFLLKARMALTKHPKIESLVTQYGFISSVRDFMSKNFIEDKSLTTTSQPKMPKSDRQLVIDDLKEDITQLELITGRDLSSWKTP